MRTIDTILNFEKCTQHKKHSPECHFAQTHHIVPKAWGGQSTPDNQIYICPTGHVNAHRLLDLYVHNNGTPPWDDLQYFGPAERELAEKAWSQYLVDPTHIKPVLTS